MLRPRKTIEAATLRAKLDDLVGALRREAMASDHDPFDHAMVAAVAGLAEALKAEADALADAEVRIGRLARKGARGSAWTTLSRRRGAA